MMVIPNYLCINFMKGNNYEYEEEEGDYDEEELMKIHQMME